MNEQTSGDSLMVEQLTFQLESGGSIPTSPLQLCFRSINWETAIPMSITHHYLHRPSPVTWAFGAYYDGLLYGICTIGKPASHTLIEGVCGKGKSHNVFELNRLWMDDNLPANSESRFVGWVLRSIPKGIILVSYADTAFGHIGFIYQATNWLYTGMSTPFVDYTQEGKDHRSVPKNRRDKSQLKPVIRTPKHRYVYFTNPQDKLLLRWEIKPYPKVCH
jgi:hypothetical protein